MLDHKCFFYVTIFSSAPQSKNAVSTNIKHSRYIHLMSNFSSMHFHTQRFYVQMFDIVHTRFIVMAKRIGRLLITSGIFLGKRKYSACDLKCTYCVFTLWGRVVLETQLAFYFKVGSTLY